tara:strand:- start:144 stop:413 length:270 start_codon:yes stop_codon:yes gene_type:complete
MAFHAANPHVYQELIRICRFVRGRGVKRWGIAACFERLRWLSQFEVQGDDPYRLNNNFRAWYSRLLNNEPGLEGLFEVRSSGADFLDAA